MIPSIAAVSATPSSQVDQAALDLHLRIKSLNPVPQSGGGTSSTREVKYFVGAFINQNTVMLQKAP